jgi:hypothetical protein
MQFTVSLNEVRLAAPTAARLREVLGKWYRPEGSLRQQMDTSATVLCTHNADVTAHNSTALQWHSQHGDLVGQELYNVHMQHNAGDDASDTAAAARGKKYWLKEPGFHHLQQVAIGARVIFGKTINKTTGQTNSAQGQSQQSTLGTCQRACSCRKEAGGSAT